MKTSHIEVSFEQHEIWRVSHADGAEPQTCPFCGETTPMIAVENASATFKLNPRQIYRLIDDGAVHFVETTNMQVLICLASLSKQRSTK